MTEQTKAQSLIKEWYGDKTPRQRMELGKKMAYELRRIDSANKNMMEALKKISAIENQMYGEDWEEIEEARDIADAAIAKATGGAA